MSKKCGCIPPPITKNHNNTLQCSVQSSTPLSQSPKARYAAAEALRSPRVAPSCVVNATPICCTHVLCWSHDQARLLSSARAVFNRSRMV